MTTLKSDSIRSNYAIAPTGDETSSPSPSVDQTERFAETAEQIATMREQLSKLAERESELRAVLARETELEPQIVRLGKILRKSSAVSATAPPAGCVCVTTTGRTT